MHVFQNNLLKSNLIHHFLEMSSLQYKINLRRHTLTHNNKKSGEPSVSPPFTKKKESP